MSSAPDRDGEYARGLDLVEPGRAKRGMTVGRILLNLVVLAAFGGAVFILYTLVQNSGILHKTPESAAAASFDDVPVENPARDTIEEAVRIGLVEPSSPSRFGPTESVSRAEFAGIVVRTLQWDVAADEPQPFGDVTGDSAAVDEADYIAVLAAEGVMGGTAGVPPAFNPGDPVLVRHVMVVFARAAGDALPEATEIDPAIAKLDVNDEVRAAYQRLAAVGALDGVVMDSADVTLTNEADREQVAVIAVNLRHFLPE
ncbi:MAG: S-layer homology domain-containing protein [Thermoleophilia bacterium]